MTKRHCYVTDVGNAIEALADALDPHRSNHFKGDILDLLEWAEKDVKAIRQQLAEREEQIVLLRVALEMAWSTEYVSGIKARRLSEEALAATADLKEQGK